MGEPVEITALNNNMELITSTVVTGGVQWFATRLVEKDFLPYSTSRNILGVMGVPPNNIVAQLMDSVYTKLRITDKKRKWYDDFVSIFSTEAAYEDLVVTLKRSVGASVEPAYNKKPQITPQDFAGFPEPTLLELMELVGMDVRTKWREVGLVLGIEESDLAAIEEDYSNTQRRMSKVFSAWNDGMTSEHSWKKIAEALLSPLVDKKKLAENLLEKLKEKNKGTLGQ